MAGALSLRQDIEALVEKHRDVALPVDLLSRLAEDARLMAVKENIRSIHEADPFGLFEEESELIEESDEEQARKNGSGRSTPPGTSEAFHKASSSSINNLPDFIERMLSMMKVTKHDKVTALNGFTTIDTELEFSLPLHERNHDMPHKARTQLPSTSTSRSSKTPTGTGKRDTDTMGDKKDKGKAGAAAGEEQKGVNETPRKAGIDSAERLPVHLHFSFVREPLGANSVESIFSGSDIDGSHEVSNDDDDDSDAPNASGVEIEMLDDLVEDKLQETTGASGKATEPKRKLSRDKAGGEAGGPAGTQKSKRRSSLKANARDATATAAPTTAAAAGDNIAAQARVARRSNGNGNGSGSGNREGIGKRGQEKKQVKRQDREGRPGRGHLKRAHSGNMEAAAAESVRAEDGKWKRSKVTDSRRGNEARGRGREAKGGGDESDDDDDEEEDEDGDGDDEGWMMDGRGDAIDSILGGKGLLQTGSESEDEESYEDEIPFEPLTMVSYTISGSIGFGKPEVLLQTTIYAKGDGPGCFTLRKARDDDDDDDGDDDDDDDEDEEGDEEDAQDANVDEHALSAIGEALGIHVPPLRENDSGDEQEVPVLISGADGAAEAGAGAGDAGDTWEKASRLTVEHLVWWLMMFPFFEKEFDIVGVVGSCIFGEDGDSDDEDSGDSDGGDDEVGLNPIANSLFVHAGPFVFVDSEEQDQADGDEDDEDEDDEAMEPSGVTIEELE